MADGEFVVTAVEEQYYKVEDTRGWHPLFQRLQQIAKAQAGPQTEARRPTNIPRNRYRDVLPIDSTRVKLNDENDYINANYVKVEEVKRSYILTQGPLPHTCDHFWQMVWEQNCKGILMLNKCIERGMNKCYPYWPQGQDEPEVMFGRYRIELISIEDYSFFRLSHLQLENVETEETRVVLHFHYTKWPDFGVPKTADDFLKFLDSVRSSGVLDEDVGPCVVHCSAGIGRSGTFCLVDACLKRIEDTDDYNSVEIQEVLLNMRKQRLGLIQTPDQLRFSYVAILQRIWKRMADADDEKRSQEEEEEDDLPGSESEEIEDEDDESGQNGTQKVNIYKDQDFNNDAPPPIPPRPPDMIRNESPSPPPPPNLPPPGGPIYVRLRRDDDDDLEDLNFRYKPRPKDGTQSESSEEDPTPWYMNGSNEVPRTAWEEDEEEAPPPPPPRNDQLGIIPPDNDEEAPPPLPPRNDQMKATPSHEAPPMRDEVTEDRVRPPRDETGEEEEEEEEEFEEDTGHFLGVGRGDETGELPPLPPVRPPRDLTPPPLPVKMRKKEPEEEREREKVAMGSSNDEEALIRELTELERLVDDKATPKQMTSEELRIKEASELRRRLREERATRLQAKVQLMQENLRTQETREYTVPLLLVGVALIVVSYSVYYYLTKS